LVEAGSGTTVAEDVMVLVVQDEAQDMVTVTVEVTV
jgi:hypothetical protein